MVRKTTRCWTKVYVIIWEYKCQRQWKQQFTLVWLQWQPVHHQEYQFRGPQEIVRYYAENWSWKNNMTWKGFLRSNGMLLLGEDQLCHGTTVEMSNARVHVYSVSVLCLKDVPTSCVLNPSKEQVEYFKSTNEYKDFWWIDGSRLSSSGIFSQDTLQWASQRDSENGNTRIQTRRSLRLGHRCAMISWCFFRSFAKFQGVVSTSDFWLLRRCDKLS